jgi:hypothetical protein
MHRFLKNRMVAFVLALSLCSGSVAVIPNGACASEPSSINDDPTGGGLGTGYGDPDAPSSSSRRTALRGGTMGVMSPAGVGDGSELQSAWMWRLRIVLQVMRGTWIYP